MNNDDIYVREQDRWLPIANVGKVMRAALPPYGKLSKEAKECMQECVSEFISFITSQAAEKCTLEKRKTLNGEDILLAMNTLGFENYAATLKIYLAKYRNYEIFKSEKRREKYQRRKKMKRLEEQQQQRGLQGLITDSNLNNVEKMNKNLLEDSDVSPDSNPPLPLPSTNILHEIEPEEFNDLDFTSESQYDSESLIPEPENQNKPSRSTTSGRVEDLLDYGEIFN
ncbi:Transcriptional activator [Komagataella phaffii CBS 7435]|uniref:Subunit of the heme-activated, glucose-repressed Hap2p/3p/4p/5p CCAAT-binding complex n=2 Tax=Komagataella phaffii TaxID=460519 RepID=C4R8H3_KOMPG|nr:Subunit of the heme-activated, glucose-repressed Hap2p/3p/4p/5p CCAAT-binding complex [Komagataella phaffii GS115]AOA64859.1 GQ67_05014T0 [Komagataella phaffii]CAH2450700.1 Transcriptional activator [Komagataella phaffii CBS 7435]AOA69890.1 GQ68_04995T0 [Komagataella phaffii GS115]CAY71898.1 Subunit of the heme-activated, glucose-repressed Hap2p/3p/4p/5p CCAAT-binding complex [Komagataella phaffii GS115]CCA40500.1 Transcriptional activator [Komagataella phaffii CBS 7435]